jgi:hypothetical protein
MNPFGGRAVKRTLRESHNEACGDTQGRNAIQPAKVEFDCGWLIDMFRIVGIFHSQQRVRILLCTGMLG